MVATKLEIWVKLWDQIVRMGLFKVQTPIPCIWKIPKLNFKAPKLVFKMQKLVFKTQKLVSPAFSLQVLGWIPHKKFAWFYCMLENLPISWNNMGNKRKFILLNQHKQLATFHKALIQLITTNQLIFIIIVDSPSWRNAILQLANLRV